MFGPPAAAGVPNMWSAPPTASCRCRGTTPAAPGPLRALRARPWSGCRRSRGALETLRRLAAKQYQLGRRDAAEGRPARRDDPILLSATDDAGDRRRSIAAGSIRPATCRTPSHSLRCACTFLYVRPRYDTHSRRHSIRIDSNRPAMSTHIFICF